MGRSENWGLVNLVCVDQGTGSMKVQKCACFVCSASVTILELSLFFLVKCPIPNQHGSHDTSSFKREPEFKSCK